MRQSHVTVCDGRTIAYAEIGRAGDACLLYFHGAPASGLHIAAREAQFAAHGLRVVAPDRPGYGGSSPQPGRSMADWPADVAALADALGIERFAVAGHSSGGAYAVACAARLGERVLGGVVLAGSTDMSWPPSWDGYLDARAELAIMRCADERDAIALAIAHFGADGGGFLAEPFDLPEPDLAELADAQAGHALTATMIEAFRQGIGGYAQDLWLEGHGWPFDPGRITVPIDVLHGAGDTLVPLAHSRHTAELIPGARLRVVAGHGHLTILSELPAAALALVR